MASERTFTLVSPHLTGEDIRQFQRDLTSRFKTWDINTHVTDDGDYGSATRDAGQQVCKGLGILHEIDMKNGVTPALRIKIRHPDTRTPQEIERSHSTDAQQFRAKLRERFRQTAAEFDGVAVASWIVPPLRWAREHGWTGHVESGFRSCEHQKAVAAQFAASKGMTVAQVYPNGPCASNHVGMEHPRGAVDVTNPEQLNDVLRNNPNQPPLVWGGPVINDRVHFSATGH
jgi:hypothetical protein